VIHARVQHGEVTVKIRRKGLETLLLPEDSRNWTKKDFDAFWKALQAKWKIVDIYDVRPWDPDLQTRIDIPEDEKPICHRCGLRHAKVVVMSDQTTGGGVEVGTGCAARILYGPTAKEKRLEPIASFWAHVDKIMQMAPAVQPMIEAHHEWAALHPKLKAISDQEGAKEYITGDEWMSKMYARHMQGVNEKCAKIYGKGWFMVSHYAGQAMDLIRLGESSFLAALKRHWIKSRYITQAEAALIAIPS
jgi:hypothetical protein